MQLGRAHSQTPYRNALARGFVHGVMRAACNGFGGGTLKEAVAKGLPRDVNGRYAIPSPIREMASSFVELQELRHRADYDRGERFNRNDVLLVIEAARGNVRRFEALPASDDKRFFLACLWTWKDLANR